MSAALVERLELALMAQEALVLALVKKLTEKTQNYGSVRALEPFLSTEDVQAIMTTERDAMLANLRAARREERGERASGLILPHSGGI